jgi:hypothetical protein
MPWRPPDKMNVGEALIHPLNTGMLRSFPVTGAILAPAGVFAF